MDKYFSIIIPTMWKSNLIHQMLPKYETCDLIKEVIIIDNDPNNTPDLDSYSKVRYYTKGTNIYVNPAWNMGVALANYKIILANDDILIADITDVLTAILNSDFDIVGACIVSDGGGKRIDDISHLGKFPGLSFGCFMYIKDYEPIPENIKIWYGDDLQYHLSMKRGRLRNFGLSTYASTTIRSNMEHFRNVVIANDIKIVNEMLINGTIYKRHYEL
jgi:hypothetical protein